MDGWMEKRLRRMWLWVGRSRSQISVLSNLGAFSHPFPKAVKSILLRFHSHELGSGLSVLSDCRTHCQGWILLGIV